MLIAKSMLPARFSTKPLRHWLPAILALVPLACATEGPRAQPKTYLIQENLDNAARHMAARQDEEAAQIFQVVLMADPGNAIARTGLLQIRSYEPCVFAPNNLGINLSPGLEPESLVLWVCLYPVNRIMDLLDIVSFHAGFEGGLYADVHVTRAAALAAGTGGGTQIGWWQKREFAAGSGRMTGFAAGPFEIQTEAFNRVGTRGIRDRQFKIEDTNGPSDLVYQRIRDYWAVGARVTAAIVGAGADFHPVELADAVAGFFFVDFLQDDFGATKSLRLDRAEIAAIEDLLAAIPSWEIKARSNGETLPVPPER